MEATAIYNLSESYDGIAAETWDLHGGGQPGEELDFYRRRIEAVPGVALDLTCGSGKHLLPLLRAGLDVEGADASPALLAMCQEKGRQQGLSPLLYRQSMETLALAKQYATLFVSVGSFQLLSDHAQAFQALGRFRDHLLPGGQLLIEFFIPLEASEESSIGQWKRWGVVTLPSGDQSTIYVMTESVDRYEQVKVERRRYEVWREGRLIRAEDHVMRLRWYSKYELILMLEKAGFSDIFIHGDYTDQEATNRHGSTVVRASR